MIIKAVISDISSLNQLINSAYRGESSKKGWTTEANILAGKRTTEDELLEIILEKKNTILKFTNNNEIVGCVLLVEKEAEFYLGMLTVCPILQNKGIGKKLLQEAEVFAKNLGFSKIVMTVITVREELIAWYKSKGYYDTGLREPFPISDVFSQTCTEPLEFMVLEKKV